MTTAQLEDIRQMPLHAKVELMEVLWNEISSVTAEVDVPQWHQDLLDERENLIQRGEAAFIDWNVAKAQIEHSIR